MKRRRLSDDEIRFVAAIYCGMSGMQFDGHTEDEWVFSDDAEDIQILKWQYRHKLELILRAADYTTQH